MFFYHGAKKVIAVETNPVALACLRRNASNNGWNIEIVDRPFSVEVVEVQNFDFMKIDIEGGEEQLLNLSVLPPCVIEVHNYGSNLAQAFVDRFGVKIVATVEPGHVFLLSNMNY